MDNFQNKDCKNTKKIFLFAHNLGKCNFERPTIKVNNS